MKKALVHEIDNYRHAACIVRGGRMIKTSTNSTKEGILSDPLYKNKHTHAELALLCKLDPEMIEGAILYVSGLTKEGRKNLSKPCECCQAYIRKFNLKAVYYSLPDGGYERLV